MRLTRFFSASLVLTIAVAFTPRSVNAISVRVMSLGHDRAELVINHSVVRVLRAGQTSPEGVTLVRATREVAVIEMDGAQHKLALGQSNATVERLKADRRGHFLTTVLINGRPTLALVDTGASTIAMNHEEAVRLGVRWNVSYRVPFNTVGGVRYGYPVMLPMVQLGAIGVPNVRAVVMDGNAADLDIVLLGMTFLNGLEMHRHGDTLTLTQRR